MLTPEWIPCGGTTFLAQIFSMPRATKSEVLTDLLLSAAELEANLVAARRVGGEYAADVDPVLARVREMVLVIETRLEAVQVSTASTSNKPQ